MGVAVDGEAALGGANDHRQLDGTSPLRDRGNRVFDTDPLVDLPVLIHWRL